MTTRTNAVLLAMAFMSSHVTTVKATAGSEFSYDDTALNGPSKWGSIDMEGANDCYGEFNSPVNVTSPAECDVAEDYVMTTGDCTIENLSFTLSDHGVKASYPTNGTCNSNTVEIPRVDGLYKALQFHIHAGSEHSIDGEFFDFELHVVHQLVYGSGSGAGPYDRTNPYAVVGFVMKAGGETNVAFDSLLSKWSSTHDGVLATDACLNTTQRKLDEVSEKQGLRAMQDTSIFNVYSLLAGKNFFTYSGGLTTPPCSEAVWWNLNTEPVMISDAQKDTLMTIIKDYRNPLTCEMATIANPITGSTSRPPQALNSRTVELYCPAGNPVAPGKEETTENPPAEGTNPTTASTDTTKASDGSSLNTFFAGAASAAVIATLL